ncbi:MAG: GNAT family N-acetyltransferase [Proteobacteria bacterium]|jgi:putative acetyltransferase|nr:GNAT family N-acetyltransferase [Pseudomonadota bacterium]
MSNPIIRIPDPSEYEQVTRVWMTSWQSAGLSHPDDLHFNALFDRLVDNVKSSWDLYVADEDGQIVGILALNGAERKLDQLFVHPDLKGRKIGLVLLDFAKQKLPDGMWLTTAEKNHRAIGFYEAAGFQIERTVQRLEYDRNDVHMRWMPT